MMVYLLMYAATTDVLSKVFVADRVPDVFAMPILLSFNPSRCTAQDWR